MANFAETYAPMIASGGAVEVTDADQLAVAVAHWLDDDTALSAARAAATNFVATQQVALDGIVDTLCAALDLEASNG